MIASWPLMPSFAIREGLVVTPSNIPSSLLLLFVQGIVSSFTKENENRFLVALFDPFGSEALSYYTKYNINHYLIPQ